MRGNGIIKKLIASIIVILLMIPNIELQTPLRAQAFAVKDISSNDLNATVKYLHLGYKNNCFNFNIKKKAQKKGAAYTWYIKPDKGNPKAVAINKKTGLVTAKALGTAYIGCKITLAGKHAVTPEAKVIVRNNITKVDICNLPKNNTVSAYHTVDFNYVILNTEGGKGKKSQGVTRFEIAKDTAGVKSADKNGVVFPAKEGTFKIRAVSFQSMTQYKTWLADKKTNGNCITASGKWHTIQVESNNSASISTQSQLDNVLNNKDITEITLTTEKETTFTIAKGDYSNKNLIVNAPNADVKNHGSFKNITVKAIKDSTWIEYADGNVIYLSDKQLRIIADSDAHIKKIVFDTADTVANVEINGIVDEIDILQPTKIKMSGTAENVPVVVEEKADGCTINSSIPLNMQLKANADITLSSGAEKSVLDKDKSELDVKVDNQTSKEIIVTTNHTNGEIIKAGENTIPTASPSGAPTIAPTKAPTAAPTLVPTNSTSTDPVVPAATPTVTPTATPTATPTPTAKPTATPTAKPTATPTAKPTATPTAKPTATPTPIDKTAPSIDASNGAVLGTDFLTITLTFSEPIINNLDSLEALKDNISMTSDNGTTTAALGTQDNIKIQSNQLIITLNQALIKENVQIIIKANSLKDAAGNIITTAITSNVLVKRNDTCDTATPLIVNAGEQKFWIESEKDFDYYSFEAQAGKAYNINITAHSKVVFAAAIVNKDGTPSKDTMYPSYMKDSDPYYKMSYFFIAPSTGTLCLLLAEDGKIADDPTGCYGINISTASTQTGEPDDTKEKASLLTAGAEALTRYIYPSNDEDWFKFEGEQLKTYTIQTGNLDCNMDTVMYLYNSAGTLIAQNDDYSGKIKDEAHASKIDFTVTEAGTYYILIKSADTDNQGKYDILLTSQATDIESYVKKVETAVAKDPEYAMDVYEEAVSVVAAMSDSAEKTAFQTRLDQAYAIIENSFITDTNSASKSGEIAYLMERLGCLDSNVLDEKSMDIGELFLKQNPIRNYTSINEIKAAFNATITQYNSILSEVNSATDLGSMKYALTDLAGQYPFIVSDTVAQAVLNKKEAANFDYISKIFALDNLHHVTFGATLRTVSGSAITYTPIDNAISATMDGVPVINGQFVENGKNVTFTVVPDSGYEVYQWNLTGDFNNTGALGGTVFPKDVANNAITFNNLHTAAGVQVEIVKSPSINIPTIDYTFSKSSSTGDVIFTAHPINTKITTIFDSVTQKDILANGNCSIDGDNVTIKKDYLCGLSTGDHYFNIFYENSHNELYIMVHITD